MDTLQGDAVAKAAQAAMAENDGLLRLAPNWVPRSFLQPGRRLKLHPADYYALGKDRGGIDERWFGSTTAAANEGASRPISRRLMIENLWRCRYSMGSSIERIWTFLFSLM